MWCIIANDEHLVSRFKAEGKQTKRQAFDIEVVVLPGIWLPDTIVLVAHGYAAIAMLFIVVL